MMSRLIQFVWVETQQHFEFWDGLSLDTFESQYTSEGSHYHFRRFEPILGLLSQFSIYFNQWVSGPLSVAGFITGGVWCFVYNNDV